MQYKGIITLLAIAAGIPIPLIVAAYQPGIGYEGKAIIFMQEPEWYGGVRTYYCNATVSLSPFFYPVSHVIASPTVSVSFERFLLSEDRTSETTQGHSRILMSQERT